MTDPIRRILVPVDYSSCSKAALSFAGTLAATLNASIEVLHVAESAAAQDAAKDELGKFIGSATLPGSVSISQRVEVGDARERIVGVSEHGFDMIVLGTHGRTGRPRMLAGSVAESVVRTASRPVVTVREPA
jgi:universal stress protein A